MTMGHVTHYFAFGLKLGIREKIMGRRNFFFFLTSKFYSKALQGDRSVVLPSVFFHPSHLYRPSPGKLHMFLEHVLRNLSKGYYSYKREHPHCLADSAFTVFKGE